MTLAHAYFHRGIFIMHSVTKQYFEDYDGLVGDDKLNYIDNLLISLLNNVCQLDLFIEYMHEKKSLTPNISIRQEICGFIKCMIERLVKNKILLSKNDNDIAVKLLKFFGEYFIECLFDHFSVQDIAIGSLSLLFEINSHIIDSTYYYHLIDSSDDDNPNEKSLNKFILKLRFNSLSLHSKLQICHIFVCLLDSCYGNTINKDDHKESQFDDDVKIFLKCFPILLSNICEEETHPCILYIILNMIEQYNGVMIEIFGFNYLYCTSTDLIKNLNTLYTNINSYFPLSSYILPKSLFYVEYEQLSKKLLDILTLYPNVNTGGCIDLVLENINSLDSIQRINSLKLLCAIIDRAKSRVTTDVLTTIQNAAPLLFYECVKPLLVENATNNAHLDGISSSSSNLSFNISPITSTNKYSKNEILLRCTIIVSMFEFCYHHKLTPQWIPLDQSLPFYNSLINCMFNYNNWETTRMIKTLIDVVCIYVPEDFMQYLYAQFEFFIKECKVKCRKIDSLVNSNALSNDGLCDVISRKFLRQLNILLYVLKNAINNTIPINNNVIINAVENSCHIISYCIRCYNEEFLMLEINSIIRFIYYISVSLDDINISNIIDQYVDLKMYIMRHYYHFDDYNEVLHNIPQIDISTCQLLIRKKSCKSIISYTALPCIIALNVELSAYDIYRIYSMDTNMVVSLVINTFNQYNSNMEKLAQNLKNLCQIFNAIYIHCNSHTRMSLDQLTFHYYYLEIENSKNLGCYHTLEKYADLTVLLSKFLPLYFIDSLLLHFKTLSTINKCILFDNLLSFSQIYPSSINYIHQLLFSVIIYELSTYNTLRIKRCKNFIDTYIKATKYNSFNHYLLFAKIYYEFITNDLSSNNAYSCLLSPTLVDMLVHYSAKDDDFTSNDIIHSTTPFHAFQVILTNEWINLLKPLKKINLCRIFIQWFSLSILKILDCESLQIKIPAVGPTVLRCLSNLPNFSKTNPNMIEKYVVKGGNGLNENLLIDNIELFTTICKTTPEIVISNQCSIAKAVNKFKNLSDIEMNSKIRLVNFFVAIVEILSKKKLVPDPELYRSINRYLCELINSRKRIVRKAAAMCKNLFDTLISS